ncbi:MAG: hypothetical protein NZ932_06435 [Candidatus Bathyarchaeota archaeon]|nr:hypothetical protein [Candidatus Bathyarchaeota archaeon]MDW8040357.1 hypothetical protein [Nitrososphaerota archaeon]
MKIPELEEVPYGSRGTIGLIVVANNPTPLPDFYRMVPAGVLVLEQRIHFDPVVTVESTSKLAERLADAARILAEYPRMGVISFTCTAGSLIRGPGSDKEEIKLMEQASNGIPSTTTTTSSLNAMRFLGWKKIAIGTPYIEEINQQFKRFYEGEGFEVTVVKGTGTLYMADLAMMPPSEAYRVGKLAFNVDPTVDGVFIACTTFRAIDAIERLEKDLGVPVITANQATAWECLRLLGINEPIEGFGELMRRLHRTKFKGQPR